MMAKRLSVKEILEAARKGGPAKPADEIRPGRRGRFRSRGEEQELGCRRGGRRVRARGGCFCASSECSIPFNPRPAPHAEREARRGPRRRRARPGRRTQARPPPPKSAPRRGRAVEETPPAEAPKAPRPRQSRWAGP